MGSTDQIYTVLLVEISDNNLTKSVGNTSVILTPINHILFWVSWVTP